MKSDKNETTTPLEAEIINRGRGPEIKGTRITVYDILDYMLECWHRDQIAVWFRLSSAQVDAAIRYIQDHEIEVLTEYVKILERCERGNPPEVQARIDANHLHFQDLKRQIQEVRNRHDAEIQELIQKHLKDRAEEKAHAGARSGS